MFTCKFYKLKTHYSANSNLFAETILSTELKITNQFIVLNPTKLQYKKPD